MQIYVSTTCSQRGFTLLELLVVVSLVAILTGVVMLGFTGADAEQRLQGEAERFSIRLRLARQFALQRNREWGLYVEEEGYRFAEFEPNQRLWLEQVERPFKAVKVSEDIRLKLELTDEGIRLPRSDRFTTDAETPDAAKPPEVWIFSSGEVTPFRLQFSNSAGRDPINVTSDGLSSARLERDS